MDRYDRAARRLRGAYGGVPVAPLRDLLEPDDASGAYRVQRINTRFWRAAGRNVVGHKIGLTAALVQAQLGVDQPDYGVLFADMEVPDGGILPPARMMQPKVEAEIALVMARDLNDPAAKAADVDAATECVMAAIEIVDSRIADWKITFADTVADNGSSGSFVLGTSRRGLRGADLYSCGMVLTVNGAIASIGAGAACLGHPLNAAAWLARTLAAAGEGLRAGDIVLTGALGPMVTIVPGDVIEARIGGIGAVGFIYAQEQP